MAAITAQGVARSRGLGRLTGAWWRVPGVAVALLFAAQQTAADMSARGWLVNVPTKDDAHQHTRRMMLQHQEQGHELMRTWFADWKGFFAKVYASQAEEDKALQAFEDNMHRVHAINTNANLTFWASGNQFSDLSWDEFKRMHLQHVPFNGSMFNHPGSGRGVDVHEETDAEGGDVERQPEAQQPTTRRRLLADSWDWRNKGISTPVRNQGGCAACWVMAGIHALEAAYMINDGTGTPVQLSAQQALDCYNVGSCQWGNAAEMMYRATFQPITTEANYPLYSDKTGATGPCQTDRANSPDKTVELSGSTGYERLENQPEDVLLSKIQKNPVVHHYEVDIAFMQYAGGVYSAQSCSGNSLNHALVAFGFDRGAGWLLLKNSWGANWGDGGYVRVSLVGGSGTCGLYKWAFRPSRYFSRRLRWRGRSARRLMA